MKREKRESEGGGSSIVGRAALFVKTDEVWVVFASFGLHRKTGEGNLDRRRCGEQCWAAMLGGGRKRKHWHLRRMGGEKGTSSALSGRRREERDRNRTMMGLRKGKERYPSGEGDSLQNLRSGDRGGPIPREFWKGRKNAVGSGEKRGKGAG